MKEAFNLKSRVTFAFENVLHLSNLADGIRHFVVTNQYIGNGQARSALVQLCLSLRFRQTPNIQIHCFLSFIVIYCIPLLYGQINWSNCISEKKFQIIQLQEILPSQFSIQFSWKCGIGCETFLFSQSVWDLLKCFKKEINKDHTSQKITVISKVNKCNIVLLAHSWW